MRTSIRRPRSSVVRLPLVVALATAGVALAGCSSGPAAIPQQTNTPSPASTTSSSTAKRAGVDQSSATAAAESLLAAYDNGDRVGWEKLMCGELRQRVDQGRLGAFPNLWAGTGMVIVSVDERTDEALVTTEFTVDPDGDDWLWLFVKEDGKWAVCEFDVGDEGSVLKRTWEQGG